MAGDRVRFVVADVQTDAILGDPFDVAMSQFGVMFFEEPVIAFANVRRAVVPGGRLVLFEGHPFEWLVDGDEDGHWALTDYDYFAGPEASRGWSPGFIDQLSIPDGQQHWKFSRAWTLGEVVTAVAGAGLRIERLVESPRDWWSGHGDIPPKERARLPLSFGLVATLQDPVR